MQKRRSNAFGIGRISEVHTDDEAHDEFSEMGGYTKIDDEDDDDVDDDEDSEDELTTEERQRPFTERLRGHLLEIVEQVPEAVEVKLKKQRSHYGTMQNYIEGNTNYGAGHDDAHAGRIYQQGIKGAVEQLQEQVSSFFHDAEDHAKSWARKSIISLGSGAAGASQDAHERMREIELYTKFQKETFDNME